MTSAENARPGFTLDVRTSLYLWLAGVFVTCLLMANIVGVKLFSIQAPVFGRTIPIEHTMGMLPFPITFLLTDLLNEYYGKRAARRVTYVAFAMAALAFVILMVARAFPILTLRADDGTPITATQEQFEAIFGSSSVMYIASIVAFLAGSLLDIWIFVVMKRLTGGKLVWLRATGSTVISQVFDSLIVTTMFFTVLPLAFAAVRGEPARLPDLIWVLKTAATGYVLKFFIAVAMTPVIYLGRWIIRRFFGLQPLPAE